MYILSIHACMQSCFTCPMISASKHFSLVYCCKEHAAQCLQQLLSVSMYTGTGNHTTMLPLVISMSCTHTWKRACYFKREGPTARSDHVVVNSISHQCRW